MSKEIYRQSFGEAVFRGEGTLWRESFEENCACARAIEEAIADNYREYHLRDGTDAVVQKFGVDRVRFVLAATIQHQDYDGRFSLQNKRWAKEQMVPDDPYVREYCVHSHPGLTDLFTNQIRSCDAGPEITSKVDQTIGGL